jgi:hypothetical protein
MLYSKFHIVVRIITTNHDDVKFHTVVAVLKCVIAEENCKIKTKLN